MRLFRLITAVCLSVLLISKALAVPTKDNNSIFFGLGIGHQFLDFNPYQKYDYDDEPIAVAFSLGVLIKNTHKVYFYTNLLDFSDIDDEKQYGSDDHVSDYTSSTIKTYMISYDYLLNYSPSVSFFTGFGVGIANYFQYISHNDTRGGTESLSGHIESKELTANLHIGMEIKIGDAWKASFDARYSIASSTRMFGDKEESFSNGSNSITNKDIIGRSYDIPSILLLGVTFSRYY